jgi:hypothetical protein
VFVFRFFIVAENLPIPVPTNTESLLTDPDADSEKQIPRAVTVASPSEITSDSRSASNILTCKSFNGAIEGFPEVVTKVSEDP